MMKYFVWIALLMFCNVGTAKVTDRSVLPNDSTVNALKIKNLNIRKADLQKQIKMEDKKRNRAIDGVDPETMEAINDKQDSICLALRSELSDIQLELNELIPQKTIIQLIQQHPVKPGKKEIKEDD